MDLLHRQITIELVF